MHSPDLVAALREDLRAAGYTVGALTSAWGDAADAALRRGIRTPAVRALQGTRSAVATLASLFVLGVEAGADDLDRALPVLGLDGAVRLGLVAGSESGLRARLELRPLEFADGNGVGEWWIASDPSELMTGGGALRENHVLGVGGASRTLLGLQLPRPVDSVLDLGTGCGIQALRASRYAHTVVATDISARALDYARLNAALNEVEGIDFRHGSLYAPVAGERFDRIVSNPPFVITPRGGGVPAYEYRDGGLAGDRLVEEVVRGVAAHLTPGGVAQLLANWEDTPAGSGIERAAGWAVEAGMHVWAVERESQDPALYAETWIRDGGTRPGDAGHDGLMRAWLDDFGAREVTSIGFGYLTLRAPRSSGETIQRRTERLHGPAGVTLGGIGAHVEVCLDGQEWLSRTDEAGLLTARLVVSPDVTEERHHWPGDEHPAAIQLRQGGGFARVVDSDAALGGLVGACDGELAVGAIVAALATLLEEDEGELRTRLLPRVRELIATGMLLPAG